VPTFRYSALTASGERVAGTLSAAGPQAVLSELEARRLTPVDVREEAERRPILVRGIPTRAMATAFQQTADLLRAGVPLLRALRLLAGARANPRLAVAMKALADQVAEGSDLADAMAKDPATFDTVHVAMVRAGERGGFLEQTLARLGKLLEAQADLRAKVLGNLIYPAVLVVFFVAVLGLIFGVFIPMFRPMFDRMEGTLGPLTKSVLIASTIIRTWGLPLLVALIAGTVSLWRLAQRPDMQERLARLRSRTPVVGRLTRAIASARFCRVLGTMLANNVPMLSALAIAKDAAGNPLLAAAVAKAAEAVRAGQRLADPLAESAFFDDDVLEMIRVGEQANNLGPVLANIADTLDARVDRLLGAAVKLIEPLMLLAVALVVTWVAMALILPMTRLGQLA